MSLTIVGQRVPMIDGKEKVRGEAKFGTDLRFPGLLFGRVLRSPHPHARILCIDTTKAERLPGVKAVVIAKDAPAKKYGPVIKDQYILAKDKVRFVGEEVAAVAAVNEETAEEALELIRVDYAELPAVFDPDEAMKAGAPQIHDSENNIAAHTEFHRGDIGEAFRQADLVVQDRFVTSMVHQCYMEPVFCVAQYDASGRLSLWSSTQVPSLARMNIAQTMGLTTSKVRVIQPYVGGGFGGKSDHKVALLCAVLASKTNRPVKLANNREEAFLSAPPRVPMIFDIKIGVKRDGTILGKETRIIADNGAYTDWGFIIFKAAAIRHDALYRYEHIKVDADLVYTNKVPTGCFRGLGNPQMTFAAEQLLDMAAHQLDMDPASLRLKNARQPGETTAHGWRILSCGLTECIQKATAAIGWEEKRTQKRLYHGIGMACGVQNSGARVPYDFSGSAAIIKLNEDGRVSLLVGEGDIGQGANTVLAQIAAEELGVAIEDIDITRPDTEITPLGYGAYASRITHLGGNAVKAAAANAKRQLLEVAAEKLEAKINDLEAKEGKIFVRGSPEKSLSIAEVFQAALYRRDGSPIIGQGSFDAPSEMQNPQTSYGNQSSAYPFTAHAAEVKVDEETGEVRVLKYAVASDLGQAINPMLSEGQVEGGVSQGIGYALMENMAHQDGKLLNPNFTDYRVPTSLDSPPVEVMLVESHDPIGPYGAKSVGEISLVPSAACIANAIYDATRIRIKELPIAPEVLLRAIKENSQGGRDVTKT